MSSNRRLLITLSFLFLLTACSDGSQSADTKKFIEQVRAETKPNIQPEQIDLSAFQKSPITDVSSLKKRNLFDANAVQALANDGSQGSTHTIGNLKLMGIFHINKKKWAIIRANGKIYKVVAGDKIGSDQTINNITENSVTIVRDNSEGQQTFTLTLQNQEQEK